MLNDHFAVCDEDFNEGYLDLNEGVVSKETVVLRRWGSSIQKFGFINGVDNVNWPPYRDSQSLYNLDIRQISRFDNLCTVANLHYQLR